ncbi:MAG: phenylalanine--tRNA ligase subunit beta [Armatimonadota bacterium]|nr:phenylalanine--tRNA ligase subunit beta [Armatimonadota bacterium]
MRVSWSWLMELVDLPTPQDPAEWEERFPMLGLGVEAVERVGDDWVFDLETTTNRPDWLGLLGVAREVAAACRGRLRPPQVHLEESDPPAAEVAWVEVADPGLCHRYVGRVVVDVRVGPSPAWMAERLERCGIRSINNVVDVTNYVMLETGQPLHAFDLDRLVGGGVVVRAARPGEVLVTLDGQERRLHPGALVIADRERVVAVGGIMGGLDTEIRPDTRRVLLESAWFHPVAVRRTARALGMRTEGSTRHERGGDPERARFAAARAAQLIQQLAGGRVLRGELDVYPEPQPPRRVSLRPARLRRVLGVEVPDEEAADILQRLEFQVERGPDRWVVTVPSHRRDVEREEDLIEEVARIYGYDRIPETLPVEVMGVGVVAPEVDAERRIRELLLRAGLTEVLTLSLVRTDDLERVGIPPDHPLRRAIPLRNPLTQEHTHLRTTLLPSLVEVLRTNRARGNGDVHVFEVGRVFQASEAGWEERKAVGIAQMGRSLRGTWNLPQEAVQASFHSLKGVVEGLLEALHLQGWEIQAEPLPWLHPYRAAGLWVDGRRAGWLGELHPEVCERYDLRGRAYVAELELAPLVEAARTIPQYRPLAYTPAVERDLAVVVDSSVPAGEVVRVVREVAGGLLEACEPFDVYAGPPVPPGRKSVAVRMRFRDPARTLQSEEVERLVERVRTALRDRLAASFR